MAATIQTLTLLVGLLALPSALAQADVVGAPPLPTLPDTGDAAGVAEALPEPVQDLLECQQAVYVRLDWMQGRSTDRRTGQDAWITAIQLLDTTIYEVPVYKSVERVVAERASGAAQPVTDALEPVAPLDALDPLVSDGTAPLPASEARAAVETVQVLDHVERTIVTDVRDVDLAIRVSWREDHIVWERHTQEAWLSLPAGLVPLHRGDGRLVEVCDGRALAGVAPALPPGRFVCALPCHTQDGWVVTGVEVDVRRARASDTLERRDGTACSCPPEVNAIVADRIAKLGLAGRTLVVQGPPPGESTEAVAVPPPALHWESEPKSWPGRAVATPAWSLAGAAGLAALGLLALGVRKKP